MLVSDTRPSVMHVITTIARGGAENHLIDLIDGQLEAGWAVRVAFLKADGDRFWQAPLESKGVQTHDLGLTRYGQPAPVARLRRVLREQRPTLVHAHMPPAELYTRLALVGSPEIPLVISKHNDEPFMRGGPTNFAERWCAARASRVIAISGAVSRYFGQRWPGPLASRLQTIRYGLDASPYDAVGDETVRLLRTEWNVGPDEFLVGTVARLTAQKALQVMIRGFAEATRQAPGVACKLVLVGRGAEESRLRSVCESEGVSDRVIFAGFRTDITVVMNAFDVFALTSDYEGFGLVLLEAMSAGKPIVATHVSAIPEVVAHGETGILVPPQDPSAFAKALVDLLDAGARASMGRAGRRRVGETFSPDAMVQATLAVYEKVVAR